MPPAKLALSRRDAPDARQTVDNAWLEGLAARPFAEKTERAIWLQIYDRLRRSIEAEEVGSGAQLPGEHQIAAAFDVNRITLRRALSRLQREGYLSARKGVGVFVRQRPARYTVASDQGFLANVDGAAETFSVRTFDLTRMRASADIAGQLRLTEGAEVIRLERVRMRDGLPIYYTLKFFPAARFPDFEAHYLGGESVSAVFKAHGVARFLRTRTRVSGGFATRDEAAALDLTPKTPVLRTGATVADQDGALIEFSAGSWPLTMVELVFD